MSQFETDGGWSVVGPRTANGDGMEFEVLFEDEALLAVNKPPGLLVHPSDRRPGELSLEGLVRQRPGCSRAILLHRLDRDTTGVVLFARNRTAAGTMTRAFEEKRVRKSYLAVVDGAWPRTLGSFESRLIKTPGAGWRSEPLTSAAEPAEVEPDGSLVPGGASGFLARTTFRVRLQSPTRTILEVLPKTGRTHQIRLHCSACGHPICGDRLYNPAVRTTDAPQALHASRVDFAHPTTKAKMTIMAPAPQFWRDAWLSDFEAAAVAKLFQFTTSVS